MDREEQREEQIAAILREARKSRSRPSKAMWIAAITVGTLGLVAFGVILFADGAPRGGGTSAGYSRLGFAGGMLIGVVVGVALGFAIARQRSRAP